MDIVYRDDWLVAVYKPAGMLVHRSKIDPRETKVAVQWLRDYLGQWVYPVHRLDKPVAGLLLMALSPEAARELGARFTEGSISKSYLAVVRGYTPASGSIDYPLREDLDIKTDARADPDKAAQHAITDYERLGSVELPLPVGRYPTARYSLLRVRPRTGRKHQIRRHLKHIFHPLVGDTTHGDGRHNLFFRQHFACARLLLVAQQLRFVHPFTRAQITLGTTPDAEFQSMLAALGWADVRYE